MAKLYVVVRDDLPPGLQAAQACHAVRQFASEHRHLEEQWYQLSKTLVLLSVRDEEELRAMAERLERLGIAVALGCAPDLHDAATALAALGAEAKRQLRGLPLMLSALH